jgi:hypothetical protein
MLVLSSIRLEIGEKRDSINDNFYKSQQGRKDHDKHSGSVYNPQHMT